MASLTDLISGRSSTIKRKTAKCWLIPMSTKEGEDPEAMLYPRAFQYYPETIQVSKQTGWESQEVAGGSHPLYEWVKGGESGITFTVVFTRDLEEVSTLEIGEMQWMFGFGPEYDTNKLKNTFAMEDKDRNPDIRVELNWLKWFSYPEYISGDPVVKPPPKLRLFLPNSGIGEGGKDYMNAVMSSMDITYQKMFPNGEPRIVEVSLSFNEVVQVGDRIRFIGRGEYGTGVKTYT